MARLLEDVSLRLLSAAGISVPQYAVASSPEEAAAFCAALGKPAIVKALVPVALEAMPRGLTFGHTSALMGGGRGSAAAKRQALCQAGASIAETFGDILPLVQAHLEAREAALQP